ncbi:MAG: hypothetical protein ACI4TQ_02185, partial [Alloprevotella sp.]
AVGTFVHGGETFFHGWGFFSHGIYFVTGGALQRRYAVKRCKRSVKCNFSPHPFRAGWLRDKTGWLRKKMWCFAQKSVGCEEINVYLCSPKVGNVR